MDTHRSFRFHVQVFDVGGETSSVFLPTGSVHQVVCQLTRTMANGTSASSSATERTAQQTRGAANISVGDKEMLAGKSSGNDEWPAGVWSSTAEPRHLPGYSGFVPGVKFKMGQSFGALTSSLLRDKNTSGSGHLVLTNFTKTKHLEETNKERHWLLQERVHDFVKDKYVEHMCVPGYTAHIPLRRSKFGGTFADDSFYALSDFAKNQRKQKHGRDILKSANHGRLEQENMFPSINIQVPLQPIAREAATYISKDLKPCPVSPYARATDDPHMLLVPGYSAFVPRLGFQSGRGYTFTTRRCINEFTDMTRHHREIQKTPVVVCPEPTRVRPFHGIYPNGKNGHGMNPRYTGYIPGTRQQIGISFGRISMGVRAMLHQES